MQCTDLDFAGQKHHKKWLHFVWAIIVLYNALTSLEQETFASYMDDKSLVIDPKSKQIVCVDACLIA